MELHISYLLCLHVMLRPDMCLTFYQRKEINRVLAPEEFCDPERRGKLYFFVYCLRGSKMSAHFVITVMHKSLRQSLLRNNRKT